MAASNKTPNLNLNQWSLDDKPQMEDVNRDNLLIDTTVSNHIGDMVSHLNSDEHEKFSKRIVFTEYFGNNAPSKDFTFSIKPIFAIAFAIGRPLCEYSGEKVTTYFGIASNNSGSSGISISGNTVTIKNTEDASPVSLNKVGITYCIAAFA